MSIGGEALIVTAIAGTAVGYAITVEPRWLGITRCGGTFAGTEADFGVVRILHLSDLHIGCANGR
jgi:hypothetical protein